MPWYGSHSYLNNFILENRCRKIMEIGVYNGVNAVSMVETAIQNVPPHDVEYYGFDFFAHYNTIRIGQRLEKTGCKYRLYEGNTINTLPKAIKKLPKMDLIFIDGGKSYREAKSDWKNSSNLMHDGTGIFIHNVDFSGVGRMVDEIPKDRYKVEKFYTSSEGLVALISTKLFSRT